MKLISFNLSGDFAAFVDPSVTTNQSTYYIPSKSAVIGLIGAMIGIERDNTLKKWYSDEYLKFFLDTEIGISFDSEPRKIVFFANNTSLKATKTKPTKKEVLRSPKYKIYIKTSKEYFEKIKKVLGTREFAYTPCLGHSYCPARIDNVEIKDGKNISSGKGEKTSTVILDEAETYNESFVLELEPVLQNSEIIIERHLHHYFEEVTDPKTKMKSYNFKSRVLRHWIPTKGEFKIRTDSSRDLSEFVKIGKNVVCLY